MIGRGFRFPKSPLTKEQFSGVVNATATIYSHIQDTLPNKTTKEQIAALIKTCEIDLDEEQINYLAECFLGTLISADREKSRGVGYNYHPAAFLTIADNPKNIVATNLMLNDIFKKNKIENFPEIYISDEHCDVDWIIKKAKHKNKRVHIYDVSAGVPLPPAWPPKLGLLKQANQQYYCREAFGLRKAVVPNSNDLVQFYDAYRKQSTRNLIDSTNGNLPHS